MSFLEFKYFFRQYVTENEASNTLVLLGALNRFVVKLKILCLALYTLTFPILGNLGIFDVKIKRNIKCLKLIYKIGDTVEQFIVQNNILNKIEIVRLNFTVKSAQVLYYLLHD